MRYQNKPVCFSIYHRIIFFKELYNYKISRQDKGTVQRKTCKEYTRPQMDKIGDQIYFIANKVYCLNRVSMAPSDDHVPYARELTPEEVKNLPVNISYIGPELEFDCDEEAFARLYTDIIRDCNVMQSREFVSAPVGEFFHFLKRLRSSSIIHKVGLK